MVLNATSFPGKVASARFGRGAGDLLLATTVVIGAAVFGVGLGHVGTSMGVVAMLALPAGIGAVALVSWSRAATMGLLCCALPVGLLTVVEAPVRIQVLDVASVAVVGLIVVSRVIEGKAPLVWSPVMWWAVGFWAAAGVSVLAAPGLSLGVDQLISWGVAAAVVLAVPSSVERPVDLELLLGALLVAGAIVCLIALPEAAGTRVQYGAALISYRPTGIFSQPNELGSFAAALTCGSLGVGLRAPRRWLRWLGLGVAVIGLAAAGLSYSRGAMIGVGVGVVVVILTAGQARWRLIAALGVALAVTVGSLATGMAPERVVTVSERLSTIGSDSAVNPYDDRPSIWREATSLIAERPLTGFGPGSFPTASARAKGPDIWPTVRRPLGRWRLQPGADHAHNTPLTIGAELGLPAMGFLLALTGGVALLIVRVLRRRPSGAVAMGATAGAGALATFVGHGLVDFTLRNPVILTTLALFVGLVLACERLSARVPGVATSVTKDLVSQEVVV